MTVTTGPAAVVPMSWEDYEALEGVHGEYIDGRLVVAAVPMRRHQWAVQQLLDGLRTAASAGQEVYVGWGWKPADDEFGPDLMVVPPGDEEVRFTGVPALVVEVLSSDRAADLVVKMRKYAEVGLPHYWVVDLDVPSVTAYQLAGDGYRAAATAIGDTPVVLPFTGGSLTLTATDLLR